MGLSNIVRAARQALKTEQGRSTGRKIVDGAADAGRRVSKGKHDSIITKAQAAAHKYLGDDGQAPRR